MAIYKVGSNGEEVKYIQKALGLVVDGGFGPKTAEAVKAWQTKNGLTADGIVGQNTLFKLVAPLCTFKLSNLSGKIPDIVLLQIPETATKFNITTPLRLAHFLSQCGHESAGFTVTSENLNYSADGLLKTFPKYFNAATAAEYARNPEKIANKVYASRMGNGNEASGDGYKYRGRGYIQLTGKTNYVALNKSVNADLIYHPERVAVDYPLMSAAWFFDSNGLWAVCDKGSTDADVTAVTKHVNGGTIGLSDRLTHFKEYFKLLS